MTINCAIIDDEPLAAGLLKSYAEKTPFLHLIGTYGSALEAMRELRTNPVQLLFLDIQMPPEGKSRNHSLSDELCLAGKCFRWRIGKMGEITHMIPVYSKAGTVRTEHRIGSIL